MAGAVRPTIESAARRTAGAAVDVAQGVARGATREAGPWLERGARLGYAARGLVYVTLGALAVQAAVAGGTLRSNRGAIATLGAQPFGQVLLLVVGVGLVAYAVWRVVAAATGAEGEGHDAKGIAQRLLHAVSGLVLGSLGLWTLRLLTGDAGGGASGGDGAEGWTARLLALPLGRVLVAGAGLGVIGYGVAQVVRAATHRMRESVRKHLALDGMGARHAEWVVRVARAGTAARGVVLGLVGGFLVNAALRHDPSRAGGLDEALAALAAAPHGSALLVVVALGLVAYGLYQFVNARWRVVRLR